jgi:hypothetical protein
MVMASVEVDGEELLPVEEHPQRRRHAGSNNKGWHFTSSN